MDVVFLKLLVYDEVSLVLDYIFVVEIVQEGSQSASVPVVSHSSSVVTKPSKVAKGFEGHLVKGFYH